MEADDKVLLGLSLEAAEHLVDNVFGQPCLPALNGKCELCTEIFGEAQAAVDGAKQEEASA